MSCIRQQKPRGIPQVFLLMDNHQALPPIAFQTHDFRKGPELFRGAIATPDGHRPATLRVCLPEGRGDGIHATPLTLPLDMPGAFQFTDPVFAHTFNKARQVQRQYPIIKGVICERKMALLFQLLHNLQRDLRALLLADLVQQVV
jgi:hypothetical protein